jgi:hypothetical protein
MTSQKQTLSASFDSADFELLANGLRKAGLVN